MKVTGKVAVITGGGGGIGGALAQRLVAKGAKVVVSDLDAASASRVVESLEPGSAVSLGGDASKTDDITALIALAEDTFGPVDLYFANAGISGAPGLDATEAEWDLSIDVNLRAHIRAAQLLVPGWIERGEGYFVSTASAAGLLTQIGSATYATTKHAAVGFSEWLNVTYGDRGIRVSCLCPMGVNTKLLYEGKESGNSLGAAATAAVLSAGDVLEPSDVAEVVLAAMDAEEFLILPHRNVLEMYRNKGSDYDRWLRGMRRYQKALLGQDN
ncbi:MULTISPECIES: SDR family oxidoreductase [Nocardiaceae]|uniref:SDR family oxidoreductase n=1 Tax=Nocardiaceae TaxID=85025 RepID=UPI000522E487|nr:MULTISPECIES: SDR family oxidoreductase [Rhodococcus]OZD14944.1 NAD(P)-dependent oxidoreductase [Rhodococcus sp. 06-156-4C]OZD19974.1 NAD(P)-dependent oxidoreductase [Rhodococcus sp. 06-156-4a]OZD22720.1 NAD(P)-dependent oxidoreductase [Rhodococcus sp. 06-156-3C]OZD25991.1 NAD(P)-dependent oxidoreductase [Rhodococcus sp. 06-156-3b]OZD38199.1 NAD(P)-dependent oxidoreductase [Rhodococcus sp. 06-156-3]